VSGIRKIKNLYQDRSLKDHTRRSIKIYYPVRKTVKLTNLRKKTKSAGNISPVGSSYHSGKSIKRSSGFDSPSAQDQSFWSGDEPLAASNHSLLALPVHHPSIHSCPFTIPFYETKTAKGQISSAKEQTDLCRSVSLLLTTTRVTNPK
jgi:hypothetical protein